MRLDLRILILVVLFSGCGWQDILVPDHPMDPKWQSIDNTLNRALKTATDYQNLKITFQDFNRGISEAYRLEVENDQVRFTKISKPNSPIMTYVLTVENVKAALTHYKQNDMKNGLQELRIWAAFFLPHSNSKFNFSIKSESDAVLGANPRESKLIKATLIHLAAPGITDTKAHQIAESFLSNI